MLPKAEIKISRIKISQSTTYAIQFEIKLEFCFHYNRPYLAFFTKLIQFYKWYNYAMMFIVDLANNS